MPTWDEPKRRRDIRSHNLDFVGCEAVLDEPHIISLRKADKHEIRRYAKETTGYSR
jgi:uncharacterized DUF497 family protein